MSLYSKTPLDDREEVETPAFELPKIGEATTRSDDKDFDATKVRDATVAVDEVVDHRADEHDDAVVMESAADLVTHVIDPRDDPELPVLTFRFWFLGAGLACFGAVLAEIYFFKPQGATVSALFQLIIAYILGNLMAQLPAHGWWRWINPGPFNIKEHAAIVIFSSTASVSTAESVSIVAILNLYYNLDINPGIAIIQTWATQCIGYAVCGVLQSALIYPTFALWPETLPTMSLLQSMHFGGMLNKKRMRFFWIVFTAIFFWEIIPSWMFPLLTAVSVICLADNGRHLFVRQLFGAGSSNEGLGLFSFSFDWILITQAFPLWWPFWSQVSSWIGMLICYMLMMAAYHGDVGQGKSGGLPFMSTSLFTSNGSSYDQTNILDSNNALNRTALEEYGRPFYTSTYQISLATHNLSCGAAVMHVALWHYKDIIAGWAGIRRGNKDLDIDDPHYQKMKHYKVVPQWAYLLVFIASMAVSMGTAYYGGYNTIPAWSVLLFTAFGYFFAVVLGFLKAVTGFDTSINGVIQLIAAFIHPGKPIANMYASLYGYYAPLQTLYMLKDQKLGQYAKVPPRVVFTAQFAGTFLGATLNYVIYKSIMGQHREILKDPVGSREWSGWNLQGTNSKAITFGALGKELYTGSGPYWYIPACLGIGLVLPIPFWLIHRRFPKQSIWRNLNVPIITNYMGWLPYSVNGMWWSGAVIGFASQFWARRYRPRWFVKYNYLLSASLDGGTQVIYFILNFAVFGAASKTVSFPHWWGNPDPDVLSVDRCQAV